MDLDKFLESNGSKKPIRKNIINESREEVLNEGIAQFFQTTVSKFKNFLSPLLPKFQGFLSSKVGAVKTVFFRTFRGSAGTHEHLVYRQPAKSGAIIGVAYPDSLAKMNSQNRDQVTMIKAYIPATNDEWGRVVLDKHLFERMRSQESAPQAPQSFKDLPEGKKFISKLGSQLNELMDDEPGSYAPDDEYEKEVAQDKKFSAIGQSYDAVIPNDEYISKYLNSFMKSAKMNIKGVANILEELVWSMSFRTKLSQRVPSLLMLGPPGTGKTSIINSFGSSEGTKIHIVEIASIYKEILGGFPVVENVFKDPKRLKEIDDAVSSARGKDTLEGDAQFPDANGNVVTKRVSMKAADIFPEEDGQFHVFFFDEFNRDKEKMAACMNLMLSGSIGTQYFLPLKTIVIAAGNLGEEIDGVNVQSLDAATLDRFTAAISRPLNANQAAEIARANTVIGGHGITKELGKEFDMSAIERPAAKDLAKYKIDMGGMVSSLDIFYSDMIQRYGPELNGAGWERDLKVHPLEHDYVEPDESDGGDNKYRLTGRKIEALSMRLKERAAADWIKAKEGKGKLVDPANLNRFNRNTSGENISRYIHCKTPEDWESVFEQNKAEYAQRGIKGPAALYLHVCQWDINYLPTVIKSGGTAMPEKLFRNIYNTTVRNIDEMNSITPEDIVYGYFAKKIFGHDVDMTIEGKLKTRHFEKKEFLTLVRSATSMKMRLPREIPDLMIKNYTEEKIKKQMEKVLKKSFDEIKTAYAKYVPDGNVFDIVVLNIDTYFVDARVAPSMVAPLIDRLKDFGVKAGEDGKTEEVAQTAGTEKIDPKAYKLCGWIYKKLWDISKEPLYDDEGAIKKDENGKVMFNPNGGVIRRIRHLDSGGETAAQKRAREKAAGIQSESKYEDHKLIDEGLKNLFGKMI